MRTDSNAFSFIRPTKAYVFLFFYRIVAQPGLAAVAPKPITTHFPLLNSREFFSLAENVVDLGAGAVVGRFPRKWSLETAQRFPDSRFHLVDIGFQRAGPLPRPSDGGNVVLHRYDFLNPPLGHPTGERVILNSPDFGGLERNADIDALIASIRAHLKPGGYFYSVYDYWLITSGKDDFNLLKARVRMGELYRRLKDAFGTENISTVPLMGYSPECLDCRLNIQMHLQIRRL